MMIIPHDILGKPLPEGERVDSEKKAWKLADAWIAERPEIAYVSLHDMTGQEVNSLWRTSCYTGWVQTPAA